MQRYIATCCPGLEKLLSDELTVKVAAAQTVQARGQVAFYCDGLERRIQEIGCADNLYLYLGAFAVGPNKRHLANLTEQVAALPLSPALAQAQAFLPEGGEGVHVSCARRGKHSYSRFDAAAAALEGACAATALPAGDAASHRYAFRLDIDQDQAVFSLKLTSADFRYRGRRQFSSAALRPTVAHAMVWASQPESSQVFADPFGGSGTIAAERAAYPAAAILTGDIVPEQVAIQQQNLPPQVLAQRWDARRLPLAAQSIDVLATNPPWGKQIESHNLPGLYRDFFQEARRVLRPSGVLLLLSDQEALVEAASGFSTALLATLSLHGTVCRLYRMSPHN